MAFQCIHFSIPLFESQKHEAIQNLSTRVSTRMTFHQWSEDDMNISNLSFFDLTYPSNCLKEVFECMVQTSVSTDTG